MSDDKRYRAWVITINNYTEEDVEGLENYFKTCVYAIYGKEIAPTTGTPHLQAYAYSRNALTCKSLSKKLPRARLAPAKGSAEDNQIYCSKAKDYKEFGTLPQQGKRTDLDEIKDVVKSTGKMSEVVLVAKSYQSVKMAEQLLKYHEPVRTWEPEVKWYYGETGTGKTQTALKEFNYDCYMCMDNAKWFEGYDAHENVIIDDMRTNFTSYNNLLKLLGGAPYRVETKGGSRQFLARRIIITSCYTPEEIYDMYNIKEPYEQLKRRINEIKEFKNI